MSPAKVLICALILPCAVSMTLDATPKMTLASVDSPKMGLAVVGYDAHAVSEMASVFGRTDEVHEESMENIAKSLTLPQAATALQNSTLGNQEERNELKQMIQIAEGKQQLRAKQSGFGGMDGARKLLNDMIHESMEKYDAEIAKCTDFYAKQCALMEVARGQISAANFQAATSRALILDAEANIKRTEKDIPNTKQELKEHNQLCKNEVRKMNGRLKVIMNDIAIMTMILKMSDCDAKLLQMEKLALLRCENVCTKAQGTITFNHRELQAEVDKLESAESKNLLSQTFANLFEDDDDNSTDDDNNTVNFDADQPQFVQVPGSSYEQIKEPVHNVTSMMAIDAAGKGDCRVELYQHKGFKGWKAVYEIGVYPYKEFIKAGAKNDDASSIKVFGIGCKAIVYKHGDFKGWSATFTTGEYDYDQFVASGAKNDDASALKVEKIPTKKPPKVKPPRPPVPLTPVPKNPCTDPHAGAPDPEAMKAQAKCTLKKSPRCYKLQQRFLQIQGGIQDQRDELMDQIEKYEQDCKEMRESLEASIENDNALLSSSQTKLAAATEKEAASGEMARQVSKENEGYNKDLVKMMTSCSKNYVDFETELCALKKIRGDLFKKMVKGHTGFFQDCEVAKWTPEACSKKCAGGEQKLTRTVLKHPDKGAKCMPLTAKKKCNLGPCPVDCKIGTWSGWSKCSAKCGGGVQQRTRDVKQAMKYGGKPCDATTETRTCNIAACSKDCVLRKWTKWTGCSKDCDAGTKKRVRFVKEPSEGAGKCAGLWDPARLQYKACNTQSCKVPDPKKVMKCQNSLDILVMMDGTPKSGKEGWASQQKQVNLFMDAFTGKGVVAKPNFAVIHYTGPRTWSGVSKCTGKSKKKVDMEKTCKVRIAQHFSSDVGKVKGVVSGLQFTPGTKLLSLALMTAVSEFPLGRATKRTVVVVFMDGEPLSYRNTALASRAIRKKARLVYVVTAGKFTPLKDIKKWVSRRWQENLVTAKNSKTLAKAETGTHLVANICPSAPKLKMKRPKKKGGGKKR